MCAYEEIVELARMLVSLAASGASQRGSVSRGHYRVGRTGDASVFLVDLALGVIAAGAEDDQLELGEGIEPEGPTEPSARGGAKKDRT